MDERIKESLKTYRRENILRKLRLINISIIYVVVMTCLFMVIYAANQQKNTSNVKVKYTRPTYTITFDPNGGSCSTSSKSVQLGEKYDTLPAPTRSEHDFIGWTLNGTTITSTSQNTTVGNHTLVASWKIWPDLPSSAGATFVNTQALQNSSGGRNKRVVQINTTKNASGTARTYKYSWDGSNWSNGASLVTKTSTGDQTLYVRVYPTGGEHYRGYVQTSTVVHLNKLPKVWIEMQGWTGWSDGWWSVAVWRRVKTATLVCWGTGDKVKISSPTSFNDDSYHDVAGWSGTMLSNTSTATGYGYHYQNGFVDSDTQSGTCAKLTNKKETAGNSTVYTTTDDGQLTT